MLRLTQTNGEKIERQTKVTDFLPSGEEEINRTRPTVNFVLLPVNAANNEHNLRQIKYIYCAIQEQKTFERAAKESSLERKERKEAANQ